MANLDILIDVEDDASGPLADIVGGFDEIEGRAGAAGRNVSNFGNIAASVAGGGVLALSGALVAAGVAALDLSNQIDEAGALAQTQLGLTAQEAVEFEDTMKEVFRNNFGEDFADIGQSMGVVVQQFERIGGVENQTQLQQVTERAFAMRDAFGLDVTESVGAVTTLMDEFGLSSEQAFGFVVSGLQRGLNSSGDFLDTIGEYSNQFSAGGASAEEFFSILETGLQSGVLGTDRIADAFKEFNIRILDDSDTTREALDAIGISYDNLAQGFADGSVTQIDAMQQVIERIRQIEDPIQRNIIGVALFGTQWEDLTEDVVLGVDTQNTKLDELEQGAADLENQYDTTRATWEDASRDMQLALEPIASALLDIGAVFLPIIAEIIETRVAPLFTSLSEGVVTAFDKIEATMNLLMATQGIWEPILRALPGGGLLAEGLRQGLPAIAERRAEQEATSLAVVNPANLTPTTVPGMATPGGFDGGQTTFAPQGPSAPIQVTVNMQNGTFAGSRDGAETGVNNALAARGQ